MSRDKLIALIKERGYERRDQPFRLSSGELSFDYVDVKRALSDGQSLELAARAVLDEVAERDLDFTAVGGLTMGADPIAHAVALLTDKRWFSVRKSPKEHGKQKLIEGRLQREDRVLLVDDVVTTGWSIIQALDAVEQEGGEVVLAVALVDRGCMARRRLEERCVHYTHLSTYDDYGVEPVGAGSADPAAAR